MASRSEDIAECASQEQDGILVELTLRTYSLRNLID